MNVSLHNYNTIKSEGLVNCSYISFLWTMMRTYIVIYIHRHVKIYTWIHNLIMKIDLHTSSTIQTLHIPPLTTDIQTVDPYSCTYQRRCQSFVGRLIITHSSHCICFALVISHLEKNGNITENLTLSLRHWFFFTLFICL